MYYPYTPSWCNPADKASRGVAVRKRKTWQESRVPSCIRVLRDLSKSVRRLRKSGMIHAEMPGGSYRSSCSASTMGQPDSDTELSNWIMASFWASEDMRIMIGCGCSWLSPSVLRCLWVLSIDTHVMQGELRLHVLLWASCLPSPPGPRIPTESGVPVVDHDSL